jgi:hypothetical protein
MDRQAQDILTTAFNKQHLAALHIDLQKAYYHGINTKGFSLNVENTLARQKDIQNAFHNAAKFSKNLSQLGIQNFWAAYVDEINDDYDQPYTVNDYEFYNDHNQFHIVEPQPNDIIPPKIQAPLFASTQDYRPLDHLQTTLIVDGVQAYDCVMGTVVNGLYSAHARGLELNIILTTDAINCNQKPAEEYLEKIKKAVLEKAPHINLGPGQKQQLSIARTNDIIEHLTAL